MNNEFITDGQSVSLRNLLNDCTGITLDHNMRVYILSCLTNREIGSSSELLLREWQVIRNSAFPNWRDQDWETLDSNFKARVNGFLDQYREVRLGQMRLL